MPPRHCHSPLRLSTSAFSLFLAAASLSLTAAVAAPYPTRRLAADSAAVTNFSVYSSNASSSNSTSECEATAGTSTVYAACVPLWFALLAYWIWLLHLRRAHAASDMHRMLLWVPLLQTCHSLLSVAYYELCPWKPPLSSLVATVWVVLSICREPVILFCLLMVAKGWCVTRPMLHPNEVSVACVSISLVYLSVINLYAVSLMERSAVIATLPMLLMYLVMLAIIMDATRVNLRILKSQLLVLQRLNIDATSTPAYTKYLMFRMLYWLTAVYIILDLSLHAAYALAGAPLWLIKLLQQTLELATAIAIGSKFRPRLFGPMLEQVQRIAVEWANAHLPQIPTVTLDAGGLRGEGTVPWTAAADGGAPPFLVVFNPGSESASLVVASRVKGAAIASRPRASGGVAAAAGRGEEAEDAARSSTSGACCGVPPEGRGPRYSRAQVAPSPSPPASPGAEPLFRGRGGRPVAALAAGGGEGASASRRQTHLVIEDVSPENSEQSPAAEGVHGPANV
ncbi:hypothetical protein AB1Y20_013842 [Prymnesium parvum]|uniref:Glycerophosphocholine acyltransferase 1 n=1 Tax=Prymnesium parvum TaxID=97485 RepID=A0AB34IFA1_PRYPA